MVRRDRLLSDLYTAAEQSSFCVPGQRDHDVDFVSQRLQPNGGRRMGFERETVASTMRPAVLYSLQTLQLFTECSGGEALCYSPARYWLIMQELASGFFVRAILACITFGIKLPAGIFVPSLAAGAAFGRILGISLQHLVHRFPHWTFLPAEDDIAPGVYALIGAAATLAGVTRTTVSLAVIVVELTGTLDYVVPVALAILAAKVSSDAILSEGIYDLVINLNDFPYLDCKKDHHFGSRSIYDVVS